MKKNGFIATSLIYSFFLIFITLFLTVIADYLQQKVLLNTIESGIKQDINNSLGIQDFRVGDVLYFTNSIASVSSAYSTVPANSRCKIIDIQYKNDVDVTTRDILNLDCNEDDSAEYNLDITGQRLTKVSNSETIDGSINITGRADDE